MGQNFATFTFTPSVKRAQTQYGSRLNYADSEEDPDRFILGPAEVAFIQSRDSFYLSTVGENGWPYMQFRGGPVGFFKVLDQRHLAFADFRGNRQYISTGNLNAARKAMLFLIDYPTRQRLKLWATSEVFDVSEEPELAEQMRLPDYRAKVERIVRFKIEAFDWNCPAHITPRFSLEEIKTETAKGNPAFADLIKTSLE